MPECGMGPHENVDGKKSQARGRAKRPTCDTVSTYHITDNARDPQRGLSRATYLLKVSRRAALPNEEES